MKTGLKITKKGLLDEITFGRYKGRTIEELLEEDPGYLLWADSEIGWFKLEAAVKEQAIENDLNQQPGIEEAPWWADDWGGLDDDYL